MVCTFLVFNILTPGHNWSLTHLQFGDLFKNTTTNGGDMGAHVWMPWFLENHWFPKVAALGLGARLVRRFSRSVSTTSRCPSVMVAFLNVFMPYNVAFKLVTVSGPLMLPAAAYCSRRACARRGRPRPRSRSPRSGCSCRNGTYWNIYGGNIASTLAGEYSFEIALALALFALGALAYTLDTGKRRWLPAVLIAAAIMSHIVVAFFVGVAALLLWLVRSSAPHVADRGRGRGGRVGAHGRVVATARRPTGVYAEHALREGRLEREPLRAFPTGSSCPTR